MTIKHKLDNKLNKDWDESLMTEYSNQGVKCTAEEEASIESNKINPHTVKALM